ncbi:MAG: hypothetical protein ACKO6B_09750 [Planctomycetia bacterium]
MNATTHRLAAAAPVAKPGPGGVCRFVVTVGDAQCELRARPIATISDVLGFEQEIAGDLVDFADESADGQLVADLLESRLIAPPVYRRRRQRPVSSRAVFFATGR